MKFYKSIMLFYLIIFVSPLNTFAYFEWKNLKQKSHYLQSGVADNGCVFPKPREPVLRTQRGEALSERRASGLDAFWAQEYMGIDLLRKELKVFGGVEVTSSDIQIWDTHAYKHGQYVSSLIAGPSPVAIIPQARPIAITKVQGFHRSSDDLYGIAYKQCKGHCPYYIHNSMYWGGRNARHVFYALNRREGTLAITGADNFGDFVEKEKAGMAKYKRLVIAGSVDPLGDPSYLSSYSINTNISVPADNWIRSYNFRGQPISFGITSATSPTAGALMTFTAVTGYPLDGVQAQTLLEKTAIHFPRLPSFNSMGAGILNVYKIGAVAFKLKDICQNDQACIASYIDSENTYIFDLAQERGRLLTKSQSVFPTCFSESSVSLSSNVSCEEKHDTLAELRRLAFLDPSDQAVWQVISCINKENGLTTHAEFYARLAERLDLSDEDLIKDMIARRDYNRLLKHAISNENVYQIMTFLLDDEDTSDRVLRKALDAIEDILYYEDIPRLEEILTGVINHDNFNTVASSKMNDVINNHLDSIPNVENVTGLLTSKMIVSNSD